MAYEEQKTEELVIPEGATEVILSYVRKKAVDWDAEKIMSRVRDAAQIYETVAASIPDYDLERRGNDGGWSPLDCIRHAAEVNTGTISRVTAVLNSGALPTGPSPVVPVKRDDVVLMHQNAILQLSEAVDMNGESTELEIAWEHPFLGNLNWKEWLLTVRVHCLDHAQQTQDIHSALPEQGTN